MVLLIANYLGPQCIAVSKIGTCLCIEFAKTAEDEFKRLVENLPKTTSNSMVYHNGPIAKPAPEPPSVSITQPVEDAPKLAVDTRPGTMLELVSQAHGSNYQTPAGLPVRQGRTNRLTVFSYSLRGHSPMVSGTNRIAGQVEKGIKNTDIGLVNLDGIVMLNNIRVRALFHSKKLGMRETYLVCLSGTEPQLLYQFGKRFEITSDASQPNSACISREQSAYLTNNSTMFSRRNPPVSICGAIILRYQAWKPGQTMPFGEACGMVNSDYLSPSGYNFLPREHIVWADDFDGLLEEGWDIEQVP
ncbi:hypothetical protein LRP88_08645 [Fusarium phalaenopsidis]